MHSKFHLLALAVALLLGPKAIVRAQEHVVSVDELQNDAERNSEKRRADEASVRELLSSEAGQKALKSAHLEYQKVDKSNWAA